MMYLFLFIIIYEKRNDKFSKNFEKNLNGKFFVILKVIKIRLYVFLTDKNLFIDFF